MRKQPSSPSRRDLATVFFIDKNCSMKVAYVLPYLQQPAGWRNHAQSFIQAIHPYVEPVLFVSAADYSIAKSLFPGDLLYPLPVTQQASLSSVRGLVSLVTCFRAIRRGNYPVVDLVHSQEAYPTGLVGSWLARKLGCPHAITTHGTYGVIWAERLLDRLVYERVLRQTRLICPVSSGTASLIEKYFGKAISASIVHPILNGNDFYKKITREQVSSRPLPVIPTLLTVGDIKPRKGQHTSLEAFARVKARFPEARYWVAGHFKSDDYVHGDLYRHRLQRMIAELKLGDVNLLGRVSDAELHRLYQESSVFVLTPQQEGLHFEGFGLVYLEAGAYGLPVVATRTGGVPDAVKEGVTGFLAEPGDVQGVAEALLQLLADADLARRMGQANRQWAETLTWERYAREQYQVYQEVGLV